ncbi:ead/Ea22-like family protein [Klebsiella pneumoniae]|uniref:ead/Ea22-like family protein n=1 Tax=Klebsiella pneumoniae TaxID=573 RepID=UPI00403EFC5B
MTTDITELAQRMKTAAEKLDADQWQTRKGFSGIEVIVKGSLEKRHGCVSFQPVAADMADTKTARAIALFSPANVLALVEALEKAQTKADVYDMLRDDYGLREKGVGLADLVDWQAKRIAELESRTVTVKLPQRLQPGADGWDDWYVHSDDEGEYLKFDDVLAMLTAAGIKVEAK